MTPPWRTVEESALTQANAEHFFQTKRLGAKLNLVTAVQLGPATLVLNDVWKVTATETGQRKAASLSLFYWVKLQHIDSPNQSKF
jgi:hypothetical protein